MKKKLENKTVLITGCLSGVGKACALAAVKEGANVIVADVLSDESEMAMEEIKKENPKALFIPCNVSKFEDVQRTIEKVIRTFRTIDVALNNSAIMCDINEKGNMSKKAWLKIIGTNLNGVFNCMSHELPEMAKQKTGVILNLASIVGKPSFSNSSHYIAAKHGIIGLTKSAALEYATKGIRINALCPGYIDKSILAEGSKELIQKQKIKQGAIDFPLVKRITKEQEIANGFIFMASEKSPFITGTAVEIDGGYLSQ